MILPISISFISRFLLFIAVFLNSSYGLPGFFSFGSGKRVRIVAIGDLHGDLEPLRKILISSQLTDSLMNWIGGDSILVQVGDIADRGTQVEEIFLTFKALKEQAERVGGQVINLIGNHELFHLAGYHEGARMGQPETPQWKEKQEYLWGNKSEVGKFVRGMKLAVKIGRSVFVHGGITPRVAEFGIERMNMELADLLEDPEDRNVVLNHPFMRHAESPLFYRGYLTKKKHEVCGNLTKALKILDADRMVVGHTLQTNGYFAARCPINTPYANNIPSLYGIDVGLSRVYGDSGFGFLEILEFLDEKDKMTKTEVYGVFKDYDSMAYHLNWYPVYERDSEREFDEMESSDEEE